MRSVALIGCGYWGKKLIKYIKNWFQLDYIIDSTSDKNVMLRDSNVESVIIATPIDTHYEIAKEAILHGKNVFVEKPITLHENEAIELKELAKKESVKIGVEYTQTFSRNIRMVYDIGRVGFMEMTTKHLGRFMDYDVYWLLASHQLSVLSMFWDLEKLEYEFIDCVFHDKLCTTGSIVCRYDGKPVARIDVSLNYHGKEFSINFYGDGFSVKYNPEKDLEWTKYKYTEKALPNELITGTASGGINEKDNLNYAMEYFHDLLSGREDSNVDTAIKITRILRKR